MTVAATDPSSHTESDQKMGYAKPGVTLPSPLKYKCTATGEKRAEPCATCNNSNNCMTDGLQIKEPTVDKLDEKSVVKLDAEGGVAACAKGDAAQCGYKPGAKVCGKCGAMATQIKVKDSDSGVGMEREKDEEAYDADNFAKAKVKDDAGEFCDCENYTGVEGGKCEKCGKPMAPVAMKGAFNVGMTAVDDPADEDFTARRKARPKKIFKPDAEKAAFAPGMTGVDHPMADDFTARRKRKGIWTEAAAVPVGLYEIVRFGAKSFCAVWIKDGAAVFSLISEDRAMTMAILMDAGQSAEEARIATKPAPKIAV